MNKLQVAKMAVTSKAGRQILKGRKHSPHILFVAGVVGVVGTVVLASRATLKLEGVVEKHEEQAGIASDNFEISKLPDRVGYSEKQYKKDRTKIRIEFAKDLTVLYAPAVTVGLVSLAALTGSHTIMTKRNTSLMAAYAILDRSYKEFQQRVEDEYGKEKALELRFPSEDKTIEVEGKNGKITTKTVKAIAPGASQYARFYNLESTKEWSPNPDYNLLILRGQQAYHNDMLNIRGHVLLNDIYDALGMARTHDGSVVGWVKNNKRGGDSYISFGLFDDPEKVFDFISDKDGSILLDFNVDGIVNDLI